MNQIVNRIILGWMRILTLGWQQFALGWRQVSLVDLGVATWGESSYLHRMFGALRTWRQGSWFLRWAEPIGAALAVAVFLIAPFVSTGIIGFLLVTDFRRC
jgi:hypothetical protein